MLKARQNNPEAVSQTAIDKALEGRGDAAMINQEYPSLTCRATFLTALGFNVTLHARLSIHLSMGVRV